MHKPTLLRILRMLKDLPAEPVQREQIIEHILAQSVSLDRSLDPQKLRVGAGIH